MRTFVTKHHSARGKYTVRLYDSARGKWRYVTVDECIPVSDGRPLFAQPKGRELWVVILEKGAPNTPGGACIKCGEGAS